MVCKARKAKQEKERRGGHQQKKKPTVETRSGRGERDPKDVDKTGWANRPDKKASRDEEGESSAKKVGGGLGLEMSSDCKGTPKQKGGSPISRKPVSHPIQKKQKRWGEQVSR